MLTWPLGARGVLLLRGQPHSSMLCAFCGSQICKKNQNFLGICPDPAGGAYRAPQTPKLVGRGLAAPPQEPYPLSALRALPVWDPWVMFTPPWGIFLDKSLSMMTIIFTWDNSATNKNSGKQQLDLQLNLSCKKQQLSRPLNNFSSRFFCFTLSVNSVEEYIRLFTAAAATTMPYQRLTSFAEQSFNTYIYNGLQTHWQRANSAFALSVSLYGRRKCNKSVIIFVALTGSSLNALRDA